MRPEIFVGVTCTSSRRKKDHWKDQLKEISRFKITRIALFPTTLKPGKRKMLYRELEKTPVKEIPLVHMREDFTQEEMDYLYQKYRTRLFNCHEFDLDAIYKRFPNYRKNILLELDYNDDILNRLEPNKIGGFCIDLAHFMTAKERHTVEHDYVMKRLKNTKFMANHLNGYSSIRKIDLHFVNNKKQFNYLKRLPKKVFGKVIGLELENTIKKQLDFKKYLKKLLP